MSEPIARKPYFDEALVISLPKPPVVSTPNSGISSTPSSTLRKVKKKKQAQQETVAGIGSLIIPIYGRVRIGAKIFAVATSGSKLILGCLWGYGEIDAVESWTVNDLAPTAGFHATHYTGAPGQVPDPTLVNAFALRGKTYTDALPGLAYSVITVPASENAGFPRIAAVIRGLKVALTEGGTPTYSTNPGHVIADFITNSVYGMNSLVDWSSVAVVAASCDATVGSPAEARHEINLALDSVQSVSTWVDVLRDYADCFVIPEERYYRLVLDAPDQTSVFSFNTDNIVAGSFSWAKRGAKDVPTVVEVTYTDTSSIPWVDSTATYVADGVTSGDVAYRINRVDKSGLTRHSEAYRDAIERYNEGVLNDITCTFTAFDVGVLLQVGDIVDITWPVGFTAKLFRLSSAKPLGLGGRWEFTAVEYDSAKFSETAVSGPSVSDTSLPDPALPPVPTSLNVVEEIYQLQTGLWASRLRIDWADMSTVFPYVDEYSVTIKQSNENIEGPSLVPMTSQQYVSGPLKENLLYEVDVQTVSTVGARSSSITASITSLGKQARPSDVVSLSGLEIGGEVRLLIEPAIDLDMRATEFRYGAVGVSWESATLLDRLSVPAIRYSTKVIPAGTWDILAKGLDSVRTTTFPNGQESVNAKRLTLTVTTDDAAFLAGTFNFTTALLFHMSSVGTSTP